MSAPLRVSLFAALVLAACGGPPAQTPVDCCITVDAPQAADAAGKPTTIIYLAFDGVSMHTADPQTSPIIGDARTNTWPYLVADVDVPAYRANDPERAAAIAAIVSNLRTYLARWNVEIVTTRPTSGDYTMVVFGGTGAIAGYGATTLGTAELDCGNRYSQDVGFVFEASDTPILATNNALFAIVQGAGVYPADAQNNCACAAASCTISSTELCTLGASVTTLPYLCSTGAPQDQPKTLDEAFGLR